MNLITNFNTTEIVDGIDCSNNTFMLESTSDSIESASKFMMLFCLSFGQNLQLLLTEPVTKT
jgi:hypothetical protein